MFKYDNKHIIVDKFYHIMVYYGKNHLNQLLYTHSINHIYTSFLTVWDQLYDLQTYFTSSYGHTQQKAPDPVRSPKLSC